MALVQQSLFDESSLPSFPPGFRYAEEAITVEQEARLLSSIQDLPFQEFQFHGFEGKRRVVSFGWRYDYNLHRAFPVEPIPAFLLDACAVVQASAGFPLQEVQQALVTEYAPGAPIGWHRDKPVYGEVMGLSLQSSCTLRLRKQVDAKWERSSRVLSPRSAYLLSGPVRWEWEHSIPPVTELRYSITFRTLRST